MSKKTIHYCASAKNCDVPSKESLSSGDVAVIGMSCRFPGASNYTEFWDNLIAGKSSIKEIPSDRWDWQKDFGDPLKDDSKTNVKWGGFIDNIDKFDASFFGISAREAELMDPQQRIVLQEVWRCIEDAGYAPSDLAGSNTGVFTGVTTSDYHTLVNQYDIPIEAYSASGVSPSILANRVSYVFGFTGPSEPVDTACSSSLIAVHRAKEAINQGFCDTAIAGGVNALLSNTLFFGFNKAGMLSPDGECRTFDKNANGYVRGEGCGLILLKRLDKAIADSDNIYGVIKGASVNHGGATARTLTAPNPFAQSRVIIDACRRSQIPCDTISYVEAHGTGTPLGDPIEIHGLKRAFSKMSRSIISDDTVTPYCGIGSVKTNVGHLEGAAGIAGVIKVILAMKHKTLPGLQNFTSTNPKIKLEKCPFYLVKKNREWNNLTDVNGQSIPRRAGVSSFGFGGANCHMLIEEFVQRAVDQSLYTNKPANQELFLISGRTSVGLRKQALSLSAFIEQNKSIINLHDIAYTLQVGREHMHERMAFITSDIEELVITLKEISQSKHPSVHLFQGTAKNNAIFPLNRDRNNALNENYFEKHDLPALAEYWTTGLKLDWSKMPRSHHCKRVSLPTHQFNEEHYWIQKPKGNRSVTAEVSKPHKQDAPRVVPFDEQAFAELWEREIVDVEFDPDVRLLDLDSLSVVSLSISLQREFGLDIGFNELQNELDTPRKIIAYATEKTVPSSQHPQPANDNSSLNVEEMTNIFDFCQPEKWYVPELKNDLPIIFIITSMRHGSSLTSFILNAHPGIYAPQGLYLLPFTNLKERAEILKKQVLFLEEGLIHTVQDLWQVDQAHAEQIVEEWTDKRMPIHQVYREIQTKCAPRILVDRGTMYGLNPAILNRAETMFNQAKYIHLLRHPYSVLRSGAALLNKTAYMKKLITKEQYQTGVLDDQLHDLIEKLWITTHANFTEFADQLPKDKHMQLKFETMVTNPEQQLSNVCEFAGLPFDESMLMPYDNSDNVKLHNMKGKAGISAIDPKVMKHSQISADNAQNWMHFTPKRQLSSSSRYFLNQFSYQLPPVKKNEPYNQSIYVDITNRESDTPVIVVPGSGGDLHPFPSILSSLKTSVVGLKMVDYAPYTSFRELATFFTHNIHEKKSAYSIVGYSSGAFIAWEMAASLLKQGIEVKNLILVDRNPYEPNSDLHIAELAEVQSKYIKNTDKHQSNILLGLIVFANVYYGVKGSDLERLIADLLSNQHQQGNLFQTVCDNLDGCKQDAPKAFVKTFCNTRQLMDSYTPSSLEEFEVNKVLIQTADSPHVQTVSEMDNILIPNCDHFSILKQPELKNCLIHVLDEDDKEKMK